MLNVQRPEVYTDFNALAKLKNEAKEKTPEAIKEVAKQFESIFVGMMIKSMRQAKLAEGLFDSNQSDFYRDMYDQQLSVHLAGEGGVGLADLIVKQLSPDQSSAVVKNQGIADYARRVLIKPAQLEFQQAASKQAKIEQLLNATGQHKMSDFINQLRPYAEKSAKALGVDANVLISQAALETGWGKSVIKNANGMSSYNLFNIKADKAWLGQKVSQSTIEFDQGVAKRERAGFRSYASYQESFNDYVDFIKTNPRYKTAIKMADSPERYMHELQKAGYATDPNYAAKVMNIYQSMGPANTTQDVLVKQFDLTLDKR